jgi:hypothetical protein
VISAAFFSASTPCCFCVSGRGVAKTALTRSGRLLLHCRAGAGRCVICSCIVLRRLKLPDDSKCAKQFDPNMRTPCVCSNWMVVITGLAGVVRKCGSHEPLEILFQPYWKPSTGLAKLLGRSQ